MRVAIPSTRTGVRAEVYPKFGRSPFFFIIDLIIDGKTNLETPAGESVQNPARTAAGSAGILAARKLVENGVDIVIAGNIGTHALKTLREAGIKVFPGYSGTLKGILERFLAARGWEAASAEAETRGEGELRGCAMERWRFWW